MPEPSPASRTALISVSDKRDLIALARSLNRHDYRIISTGGTSRMLAEHSIAHTRVADVTGFPEILGGRVKTLHPAIHAGILADRSDPEDVATLEDEGIDAIDIVCINLYPFERTIARSDVTLDDAIEQIDIGGPAMIRAAAKNHAHVAVITDPAQYDAVIRDLDEHNGAASDEMRRSLANAAFARTAAYDSAIGAFLADDPNQMPGALSISTPKLGDLRYGENPHQRAALYADPGGTGASLARAEQLHGKDLSFNNLADANAALGLARELAAQDPARCAAVVVKHTNPCGAATSDRAQGAVRGALQGDPLAAYGGILASSATLDTSATELLCRDDVFLELVIAPAYDDDALDMLQQRWKNLRILRVSPEAASESPRPNALVRSINGGYLLQAADEALAMCDSWHHRAGPPPNGHTLHEAGIIWLIAKHLTSNAIAIGASADNAIRLFGAGAGQMDRVASCRIAAEKAGELARGAIAASDAFFPFPDGPMILIDAGVTTIVHPGGSRRDDETFELAEKHEVTCLTTGVRHFRH